MGYGVQSSAWHIRIPAAEDKILNHYSSNSTVRTVLDILFDCLEEIYNIRAIKKQTSFKILSRYVLLTMLLKKLEEDSGHPAEDLLDWSPKFLSKHVLKILDLTIQVLRVQNLPNYFFNKSNLLVNPGHLCEEDYLTEANNVKSYLIRLFDESLTSTRGIDEFDKILWMQESETALLNKWKGLLIENSSPSSRSAGIRSPSRRRLCFSKTKIEVTHSEYTERQLEYIGLLLENVLKVKQIILSVGL